MADVMLIIISIIVIVGVIMNLFKKRSENTTIEKFHKWLYKLFMILVIPLLVTMILSVDKFGTIEISYLIFFTIIVALFWIMMLIDALVRGKYVWAFIVFFLFIIGAGIYYELDYGRKSFAEYNDEIIKKYSRRDN